MFERVFPAAMSSRSLTLRNSKCPSRPKVDFQTDQRLMCHSYFDSIDRIAEPTFIPADQDILRSRLKTTGVAEFSFTAGTQLYRIIDVGGQRSERKKWMHHFDDVDMVLFLIALSEYDQALYEDGSVNRLQEALDLFNGICRSPWFSRTTVQLVFNKTDLFREKLKTSPLECYFPDFQGKRDIERGFLERKAFSNLPSRAMLT